MTEIFRGKQALVTGGSRGIGRAIAARLTANFVNALAAGTPPGQKLMPTGVGIGYAAFVFSDSIGHL